MKDGGHMVKIFVDIFPESYRSHLAGLFQEIQHVLSRYIRGQILMSCIIATLTFLGMWAMGVPYPWSSALGGHYRMDTHRRAYRRRRAGYPAQRDGQFVPAAESHHLLYRHPADRQPPHHASGHGGRHQPASGRHRHRPAHRRDPLWRSGMILTVPVTAVLQILCKHLWFYNSYREKAMKQHGNE